MSTATYSQPIYRSKGTAMSDRSTLQEIILKVKALRRLTTTTGFHTTRSIGMLLANLSPDELVEVSEALELTPREMPR